MTWRLSQLNWPRILFTRSAAIILGTAAVLSAIALMILINSQNIDRFSHREQQALSIAGAAGAFGYIALLLCMIFFWNKCDESSKLNRTIWFVILLGGFAYGSQIAYYAIVYLPTVLRRLRDPEKAASAIQSAQMIERRSRIGPFRRAFLIGWGFLVLPLIAAIVLPKSISSNASTVAAVTICFFLWSALVVFEAVFHVVASFYRSGINRLSSSDGTDSSHPRNRS